MTEPDDSKQAAEHRWAEAYIENGEIVIRVPISVLPDALKQNPRDDAYSATLIQDLAGFAKDIVHALNDEEEDGTTRIHSLFDAAMAEAIDQGSMHVEYREVDAETGLAAGEEDDSEDDSE